MSENQRYKIKSLLEFYSFKAISIIDINIKYLQIKVFN